MAPEGIVIEDYNPEWAVMFQREAGQLHLILGALADRIEHVGSTAVPGLPAKPVIDIQVSVTSIQPRQRFDELLAIRGYVHVPFGERDARYPFFQRPALWPTAYHLHLCEAGSGEERDHIAFREYLRNHPETAREYARLKRRLAEHSAATLDERQRYSEAKTPFIADVLRQAFAEGY